MSSKLPRAMRMILVAFLLASGAACGTAVHVAGTPSSDPAPAAAQLAQLRAQDARYQNLANAIIDGYYPSGGCMQDPRGAMGQHYVNQRYLGKLDPMHPPELFYVPVNGTMKLAGVEWYADASVQTPALFGRTFDGPMAGHFPGQPEHYDLHVWLYIDNPAGLFAQWDPALTCG